MKKIIGTIYVVCLVAALAGCASKKPATEAQGGMPEWVLRARNNAPEDVIVGVGTARLATTHQSMTTSETRARTQIVRAMESMVRDMVTDYTAANEVDPNVAVAFQEQITRSLAQANISGARIAEQNSDREGAWWTIVYFNKADVSRELSQAQAAARLAVPAAVAFDALNRMDNAFDRAAREEWFGDN
jgi:type IV pilus biogenesis protein CpaD/CtpE